MAAIVIHFIVVSRRIQATLGKLLGIALLIVSCSLLIWTPEALDESLRNVSERFHVEDLTSGRNDEARGFVEDLTFLEATFGRGFGGSHWFSFGTNEEESEHGQTILHYGYLHLILKGGIVLLLLTGALFLLGIFRALRQRELFSKASAAAVLIFVLANVGHTQFTNSPLLPLFWVILGHALSRNVRDTDYQQVRNADTRC
ncbi:MAG: hypothetical protein V1754_10170 [Pseudomonadota bacterium]